MTLPGFLRLRCLHFGMLLLPCFVNAGELMHAKLEESVCGIKEPFLFWLWSGMAGRPDSSRIDGLANVEDISMKTTDGRTLRGYKLKALTTRRDPHHAQAYLLVVQGNAMLADQILNNFTHFSNAGVDVYIFDYRGYGRSEGKRRLKAMVSDYMEIIDMLNSRPYSSRLFYAMSFGGIVLLNALHRTQHGDLAVIDSTPSRLSDYGCPQAYDPVNNLPREAANLLFIVGGQDHVVTAAMSRKLIETAHERGASILRDPEMAHPFMDRNPLVGDRRKRAVSSFVLKQFRADRE